MSRGFRRSERKRVPTLSIGVIPLLAALSVAASSASAQAANVAVDAQCYVMGRPISIIGVGFTPNGAVTVAGAATGFGNADATGRLPPIVVMAPSVKTIAPRTITLDVADVQTPANTAKVTTQVVRGAYYANAPIDGAPRDKTTWRFAGFVPGRPIYGHFRRAGKTRHSYRFGTATGACGTRVVRARRVPIPIDDLHAGRWQLKLDQSRRYRSTTPGRVITFRLG